MAGSLASASRASQFANQINSIGALGTSIDQFSFDLSSVETIVGEFITAVKESIQQEDLPVSGSIENISMSVNPDDGVISIYGNEHLIYVDRGVRGAESSTLAPDSPHAYTDKMPPVDVFVEWIKRKNINLRNNEFFGGKASPFKEVDEEKAILKMAWGMAKNRFKDGVAPRPVFSKHIPDLIENIKKEVTTFTASNIKSMITNRYGHDVLNKSKS